MKYSIAAALIMGTILTGCYTMAPKEYSPPKIEQHDVVIARTAPPAPAIMLPEPQSAPAIVRSPHSQQPSRELSTARAPASAPPTEPVGSGSGNAPSVGRTPPLMVPPKNKSQPQKEHPTVAEQLQRATMAFSVPERANISDDVRVELLINLRSTSEQLVREISEIGRTQSQPVLVSRVLIANVTAPDFDVKPVVPERQILHETETTTWLWTLNPKSVGIHKIDVSLTAVINDGSTEREHHIKTFKKTVEIEITAQQLLAQWFAKYWQWLSTTIVLPLLLWWYKSRKRDTSST